MCYFFWEKNTRPALVKTLKNSFLQDFAANLYIFSSFFANTMHAGLNIQQIFFQSKLATGQKLRALDPWHLGRADVIGSNNFLPGEK